MFLYYDGLVTEVHNSWWLTLGQCSTVGCLVKRILVVVVPERLHCCQGNCRCLDQIFWTPWIELKVSSYRALFSAIEFGGGNLVSAFFVLTGFQLFSADGPFPERSTHDPPVLSTFSTPSLCPLNCKPKTRCLHLGLGRRLAVSVGTLSEWIWGGSHPLWN